MKIFTCTDFNGRRNPVAAIIVAPTEELARKILQQELHKRELTESDFTFSDFSIQEIGIESAKAIILFDGNY